MIFPSLVGTPMRQVNLYNNFKKTIRQLGLPEIRFHDLRHTAASIILNHNVPVIVVSKRLGHAKVSITLNVYAHLIPESQKNVGQLMDDLIFPIVVDNTAFCTPFEIPENKSTICTLIPIMTICTRSQIPYIATICVFLLFYTIYRSDILVQIF